MVIERLEVIVSSEKPDKAYLTVEGRTYKVNVDDYLALKLGQHITPYELQFLEARAR